MDHSSLTIAKAIKLIKNREISPQEVFESFLSVALQRDKDVHGFLEIFEKPNSFEENAPLAGMPIAIKDNILIRGKRASAASKILEGFVSPYSATAVEKLVSAGAVPIGRTNMDEFAMGSSTENSAFGPTKNPYDHTRVAGGSSGGSAAVVALGGAIAGLGSETGGSVRQPASFCGVVGLKPTYGAVSRYGLIAMSSSLDQIGSVTKTVEDAQILFDVIKGKDPLDSTSNYESPVSNNFPKVVGIPKGLLSWEGLDKVVIENFEESVNRLKKLGYEVREVDLPRLSYSLAVYYIIMPAEVSSNLARFDGVKYGLKREGENLEGDYMTTRQEGFGKEVRRRILLGTYVLSAGYYDAYYGTALKAKAIITSELKGAFKDVAAIITPTTPTPPFLLGEKMSDPLSMYLADIFTVPANISGMPAISVPSGTVRVGGVNLPLGLQLMSDHYREDILFSIGKEFLGESVAE